MSIEDLVGWAYARSPVVMANEAHDGLARCVRTRRVGMRMVRAAHELGVRRLAMEALTRRADGTAGPIRRLPPPRGGYLAQPDMRELIGTALGLGWTLWAYEIGVDEVADRDPAELLTMAATNRREDAQARNLCDVLRAAPDEPLLVWCGNSHAYKESGGDWIPMGHRFAALSGVEPFVIDQTVTVDWPGHPPPPEVAALLADLADLLRDLGGAAAIPRAEAPGPWRELTGVDAVVVAADNAFT